MMIADEIETKSETELIIANHSVGIRDQSANGRMDRQPERRSFISRN